MSPVSQENQGLAALQKVVLPLPPQNHQMDTYQPQLLQLVTQHKTSTLLQLSAHLLSGASPVIQLTAHSATTTTSGPLTTTFLNLSSIGAL